MRDVKNGANLYYKAEACNMSGTNSNERHDWFGFEKCLSQVHTTYTVKKDCSRSWTIKWHCFFRLFAIYITHWTTWKQYTLHVKLLTTRIKLHHLKPRKKVYFINCILYKLKRNLLSFRYNPILSQLFFNIVNTSHFQWEKHTYAHIHYITTHNKL